MRLWSTGSVEGIPSTVLGRLTSEPITNAVERADFVPFGDSTTLGAFAADWRGYPAVLCTDDGAQLRHRPPRVVFAPPNMEYLAEQDVVAIARNGNVRVWYRRNSENNTILLTEQCNSFCLMCSQPPKAEDDSGRVPHILRLLDLIDPAARILVLSGGEPTLLGDALFRILEKSKNALPATAIHLLTNGRRFADRSLAERISGIGHADLVLGIPLYSDIDTRHDYVVQANGAYAETIAGFHNLAAEGVRLELRVVLHKQTYSRLPQLARFIARNLPFIEHVALMGLEMYGFAPRNIDTLWIDPADYANELSEAVRTLALGGMNVSIYNHQLCTIPRHLWPFAQKSISDWKNVYLPECAGCSAKAFCGGFFQSGTKRTSVSIKAQPPMHEATAAALRDLFGYT
jgi:His-Xaa-Ser system radical SAM maturase HxsC